MNLPEKGILLAPANQHLLVYEALYKSRGNQLGIEVYPLETWIASLYEGESQPDLKLLFELKNALEDLNETNSFYESRQDADFLKSLLEFLRLLKTWNLNKLPSQSKKDRDLYEILHKVKDIDLFEDHIAEIKNSRPNFDEIYILKKEYPISSRLWVDWLLENGAHEIKSEKEPEKFYWSSANTRKSMELAAREILDQNYDASDIMFALANRDDAFVLEQILEAHGIPYSYLKKPYTGRVTALWNAALSYIIEPSLEHAEALASLSDEKSAMAVAKYRAIFEETSNLLELEYEPNVLISEDTFWKYRQIESDYRQAMQQIEFIGRWNLYSLEDAALFIQKTIPSPEEEDIQAFERITGLIASVSDKLKTTEDLRLLKQFLSSSAIGFGASELEGAVIAQRQDISVLRPIVFYIGVHSGTFPGLQLQSGIFDENYLERAGFIPLSDRIEEQRTAIFETLEQPEKLYIICPQSDYAGKSLEASPDLNAWMKMQPQFIPVFDTDYVRIPKFQLGKGMNEAMFLSGMEISTSASRMDTYAGCPLQHYLRFGLKIRREQNLSSLYIPGKLFNTVLEKASHLENREYYQLTQDDIKKLVNQEFSFVKKVFPQREKWIAAKSEEYAFKISTMLEPLSLAATRYHLNLLNQAYIPNYSWKNEKGMQVNLKGPLESVSASSSCFTLTEPLEGLTVGALEMNLKDTAAVQNAMKVSYRKKVPEFSVCEEGSDLNSYIENTFLSSWQQQNLPDIYAGTGLNKVMSKPSFLKKEEEWKKLFDSYTSSLGQDAAAPVHQKNTCLHCAYKSICRNAAREAGPNSKEEFHAAV